LPAVEVEIRPVVDGQRRSILRPLNAVRDRGVDRVSVAQGIVQIEVVEQRQPFDVQARPVREVAPFTLNALARDEVGPEDPTRERSYVEVEIVDLVLTRRVSEDVESDKTEGGMVFLAVDADVNAFHEAVVYCGEQLCLRPRRGVCSHAGTEQIYSTDDAIEVGDGRRLGVRTQELEVERGPGEDGLRNRLRVDHRRSGYNR
jgi:hypothetical protein